MCLENVFNLNFKLLTDRPYACPQVSGNALTFAFAEAVKDESQDDFPNFKRENRMSRHVQWYVQT